LSILAILERKKNETREEKRRESLRGNDLKV